MGDLASIDKAGWVLYDNKNVYSMSGQFSFGRSTDDNYLQHIWDRQASLKTTSSPAIWGSPGIWTSRLADE